MRDKSLDNNLVLVEYSPTGEPHFGDVLKKREKFTD